jgi:hypothetical protein
MPLGRQSVLLANGQRHRSLGQRPRGRIGALRGLAVGHIHPLNFLKSYVNSMKTPVDAPVEWVEPIGQLRLPTKTDMRLQQLMDRNTEGRLAVGEREELESLVELSERLSLIRAEALLLLSRHHS